MTVIVTLINEISFPKKTENKSSHGKFHCLVGWRLFRCLNAEEKPLIITVLELCVEKLEPAGAGTTVDRVILLFP